MSRVLVIGSGGREHALCWGIAKSTLVSRIYASPGNAGTATENKCENIPSMTDIETVQFCIDNNIELVVIGPEAPLVTGLSDFLREQGIPVFGASKAAAQLESSKGFATRFMQRHHITIPASIIVTSVEEAQAAVMKFGGAAKSVIKADGLAGGKGVFLPEDETEALEAISRIAEGKVDGDGSCFIVQKRNHGPEVSVFVLSDGKNYQIIPLATQDHKRLLSGDAGPNTGGMGAYAPLPDWMLTRDQWSKIEDIAAQSIAGMAADGIPYQGVLYLGLMLAEEIGGEPLVIEYNARFGDPETEVIIPILEGNGIDIYTMLYATATNTITTFAMPSSFKASALTICLAAEGYPETPVFGRVIEGLDESYRDVSVFHGGTKKNNAGEIISSGGRVLFVTGLGVTLEAASAAANAAIGTSAIHFTGMQYRHDIAWRALSG